ncbi:MAG: hypothetical protein ACQESD_07350 [Thermoplasmatota archaeon]
MPYSIPSDEEIRDALKIVMKRMKGVGSLRKLRKLVLRELRIKNDEYTVSSQRLRKIAVTSSFIHTNIKARKDEDRESLEGKCPVCGNKLNMTKNETLFGGTVTLGYKCTECPYWTSMKRRVPIRYGFEYEKGS